MDSKCHSHSLQLSTLWGFCAVADQRKVECANLVDLLKPKQVEHDDEYIKPNNILFVFVATVPPTGPGPPHSRGFYITHNDTAQSVGLLRKSDQLVAETST